MMIPAILFAAAFGLALAAADPADARATVLASGHRVGAGDAHDTDAAGARGPLPRQLNTARSQASYGGHFRVSIAPKREPIALDRAHSWVLEITTPEGAPVAGAAVSIAGGMPGEGRALPAAPRVSAYLGAGKYLIDGMRFDRPGWWALRFEIAAPRADAVNFNIIVD